MQFGEFRVDADSGELFRDGVRVKLQDLPFRVLVTLLNSRGEVVTREQLRARLWGAETFVDAEAGLNTAIAKLREALGETADAPRFIETLPKRGYRLRMPPSPAPERVEALGGQPSLLQHLDHSATDATPIGPTLAAETSPAATSYLRWPRRTIAAALVVLIAVAALVSWARRDERTTVAVMLIHNETGDAQYDQLAQQLTDGTVVALTENTQLDVIGNAAILRSPRIFTDIQKVGEALRADFVLIGQLQRGGEGLVVRTHFIRVDDQKHLWARPTTGDPLTLDAQVPLDVSRRVRESIATRR